MANNDLTNYVPLVLNRENFYTTAYSMEYLEALGLLKMDFLGLRNLSLISDVISEINKDKNINLTFDNIPENDSKAFKIFEDVNTLGIFQFESQGMMNFLRKFRPNNYEEISAAVALFRPGPKDNIDTYIKRKRGNEPIEYYHQALKPILEPTYGVIIYQEQIMQIASKMAGYTLGEADVLRRAMGKKDESILIGEKDKFISRSISLGYDKKVSGQIFNLIYKFANYGFNRAHSFVYAMVAYKMAYLKANYPAYFMKSLLTMVIGSESKTKEYIYECKLNNISILKPDINLSIDVYNIEEFGIRYPLTNIKNVGLSASKIIIEQRANGKFKDIFDFVKRTYGKSINRKTIESLIDAGCFTSLGLNKKTLHHNLDLIINYAETFGDLDEELMLKPELTIVSDYTKQELMQMELDIFGFYLSNHPVSEYKLRYKNTISLKDIDDYFDKTVDVIVYIDRTNEVTTKKKDKMLFITGSDEATTIDIVLFPDTYKKFNKIDTGDIALINGKVEKRFDKIQVVTNEITKIG
jgi:DNA polymerase-3 subunit alpha